VAVGTAIERAAAEGHCAFDFLRGAERYKYWWGARNAWTFQRRAIIACRKTRGVPTGWLLDSKPDGPRRPAALKGPFLLLPGIV
jgi:hypothetical protein